MTKEVRDDLIRRAATLVQGGASIEEAARKLGFLPVTVRRWLRLQHLDDAMGEFLSASQIRALKERTFTGISKKALIRKIFNLGLAEYDRRRP
jgi:transposase-like protein